MQAARAAREAIYRFEQMKSRPAKDNPALRRIVLAIGKADEKRAARGLAQADGNLLVAGSTAGNISLSDLSSGASPDPVSLLAVQGAGPSTLIWNVAFNPGGNLIAARDNHGIIYFWDVKEKQFLTLHPASSRGVTSLAFSPDGRYLVTGGLDGVVRLWAAQR